MTIWVFERFQDGKTSVYCLKLPENLCIKRYWIKYEFEIEARLLTIDELLDRDEEDLYLIEDQYIHKNELFQRLRDFFQRSIVVNCEMLQNII